MIRALGSVAACLGAPALAQESPMPAPERLVCTYTQECLDTSTCAFAQFAHDVALPQTFPGSAVIDLGTGPARGEARIVNDTLVITATDRFGAYLLSNADNGFARLHAQFADPLTSVTYHGECRVVPRADRGS